MRIRVSGGITNHNKQNERPRYILSQMLRCTTNEVESTLDATGDLHIYTGKEGKG